MALGKFPEAVYDFTWAIQLTEGDNRPEKELNKKLSEYHRYAGQAHFEMCVYQEAKLHFQAAFEKDDTAAINSFNRGLVRSKLGEYSKANADFNHAIKLFKYEKEKTLEIYYCRYNLGINFRHMKLFDQSIAELRLAYELFPEKASVLNNIGLTYFENKEF